MNQLTNKQTIDRGYIVVDWSRMAAYDRIARRAVDLHEVAIAELAYRAFCAGGYLTVDQTSIAKALRIGRVAVNTRIAALERDGIIQRRELPSMIGRGQQLTLTEAVLESIMPNAPISPIETVEEPVAPLKKKRTARWASPEEFAAEARSVNAAMAPEKQLNDIDAFIAYWAAIDEHTGRFAAEATAAKAGRWSMAGRIATWRQREDTPRHSAPAQRQNSLDFAAEAFNRIMSR